MFISIVKREFQDNLFSLKFSLILIVCLVLFLASAYLMTGDYQKRVEQYSAVKSQKGVEVSQHPPIPMSVLARGLDNSMGYDQQHNPLFSIFETLDFIYIVKVALSLMAIFFSFGLISGEKENGTLALTMSNPVSRSKVILGKWIGNYAALIVPFLIAVTIGFLVINLSGAVSTEDGSWARMGLMVILSLIYISAFFGLGVLISTLTRKASTSLTISLLVWAVLLLAVPSIAVLVSKRIVDVPSVQETEQKKEAIRNAIQIEAARKEGQQSKEARRKLWDEAWKKIGQEHKKLDDLRRQRLRRLVSITKHITRISPSAAYVFAGTTIAYTGIEDSQSYEDLEEKSKEYRDLAEESRRDGDPEGSKEYEDLAGKIREEANHRQKDLPESLRVALPDIVLLLLINVLLFMCAYVAFMRYDVRLR